jgi:hypothetical protein
VEKLVKGIYKLSPIEGAKITIAANGTLFLVVASLMGTDIEFADRVPFSVPASMLNGEGSVNRVHIHLLFSGATDDSNYTITVADDAGAVIDTIVRRFGVTEDVAVDQPIVFRVRM